jgi:hypothetical protein
MAPSAKKNQAASQKFTFHKKKSVFGTLQKQLGFEKLHKKNGIKPGNILNLCD